MHEKNKKFNQDETHGFKHFVVGGLNIFTSQAHGTRQTLEQMYDQKYARRYAWAKLWFSIDVALLAVAVLLFATAVLSFARSPTPRTLLVTMTPVAPPRTGDTAELAITIANRSKDVVRDAVLALEPPETLILEGDTKIPVGTLAREELKTISVRGLFLGVSTHAPSTLIATISGKTTRGSEVREASLLPLLAKESALTLRLVADPYVAEQGSVILALRITSDGSALIQSLIADLAAPASFRITSSSLPKSGDGFDLGTLLPGEEKVLVVQGDLTSEQDRESFAFRVYANPADIPILLGNTNAVVKIVRVPLTVSIPTPDPIPPGYEIVLAPKIENQGEEPVQVSQIEVTGSPLIFRTTIKDLGELDPGKSIAPVIHIPTHAATSTESLGDQFLQITVWVKIGNDLIPVKIDPVAIAIQPKLAVAAEARYWSEEGDQLGRGPIPPKIGRETTYWVFIRPTVAFTTLEKTSLELLLGENVVPSGGISLGEGWSPLFKTKNGYELHGPGLSPGETPTIGIGLTITPTKSQIGTAPSLIDLVRVVGIYQGLRPAAEFGSIITTRVQDSQSQGNGLVRP